MASQYYSVSTLGGNWSVPYLAQNIRSAAQPLFRLRQFVDVKEEIGKKKGDTWNFNKTGNVATQGGVLVETSTIPETNFVTNQGTGSITEYGNAIAFTSKLNSLGQFEVEPVVEQKLRDDQVKVLESAAGAQFVLSDYVAVCVSTASTTITTNGTPGATATADLTGSNVRDIINFMKKKNIPKYDGQNYMCVASVSAMAGMFGDTGAGGWVDINKYTDSHASNVIMGEVGKYFNCRFVEETGYFSSTIGSGSTHGQAVFFGADSVYEAVAVPEDIRAKTSTDYGRDLGLAWYALLGFKLVWSYSADSEQHVVFVTSA